MTTKSGYIVVRTREGKYDRLHRVIGEFVLGRPMKTSEHVHHVDLNRKNNDRKNMVICSSSYHAQVFHNINDGRLKREDSTNRLHDPHEQQTAAEDIDVPQLLPTTIPDAQGPRS